MRVMCGVLLKDRKGYTYFMFLLGLNEAMDQLAIENSVRWYGRVLRREDGHVLRRALDFEVEGQRKKWRPKRKKFFIDVSSNIIQRIQNQKQCDHKRKKTN